MTADNLFDSETTISKDLRKFIALELQASKVFQFKFLAMDDIILKCFEGDRTNSCFKCSIKNTNQSYFVKV